MNTLADFPADRFQITAYCACGHGARVGHADLPDGLPIERLRRGLRCSRCGGGGISIRIAWKAGGGFHHSPTGPTPSSSVSNNR